MKLLSVVLAFGLTALVTSERVEPLFLELPEPMANCFIKYFKGKGLLRADFPVKGAGDINTKCSQHISKYHESMLGYFQRKAGSEMAKSFLDNAKSMNFMDVGMREEFYRATKTSLKWTTEEIAQHDDEFESKLFEIMQSTDYLNQTISDEYVSSFFNTFKKFKGDKDQTQYCLNTFVVDKQLIDTNVSKVELNPKKINTAAIDCGQIMKDLLAKMGHASYGGSKFPRKACHDEDIDHKLPSIYAELTEIVADQCERTEEQKKAQRAKVAREHFKLSLEGNVCDYETNFFLIKV